MASSFPFDFSSPAPADQTEGDWWFILQKHRLVLCVDQGDSKKIVGFPKAADVNGFAVNLQRQHYVGSYEGIACYTAEIDESIPLPEGTNTFSLRKLFGQVDEGLWRIAGRASHIMDWDRNHVYCGRCGEKSEFADDRGKICPNCGLKAYPRISPAVIMAIIKGDEILLGRANRHPEGFYSVLAGFSEPGETLEETVAREVREEVGIEVKNIRYFGSQPWPFPNSLMIGFICEYASGEIVVDQSEIHEAGWYRTGAFPGFRPPSSISIAGELIDWFEQEHPAQEPI